MAPVSPRSSPGDASSPGLHDFMLKSPHIFWAVTGVFSLAFVLLFGYGIHKFCTHMGWIGAPDPRLDLYVGTAPPRSLLLPRLVSLSSKDSGSWRSTVAKSLRRKYTNGLQKKGDTWIEKLHGPTLKGLPRDPARSLAFARINLAGLPSNDSFPPPEQTPPRNGLPGSTSLSPASKAWAAEHDRYWAQEAEQRATVKLEPIPWVLYVPKEPIVKPAAADLAPAEPIAIAFPEPCVVKGTAVAVAPSPSPKVAAAPALETIAEAESVATLEAVESAETIWSQDSADFSVSDLPPLTIDVAVIVPQDSSYTADASEPSTIVTPDSTNSSATDSGITYSLDSDSSETTDSTLPSITIDTCPSPPAELPAGDSFTRMLAALQLQSPDRLQVPVPDGTRPSAPMLGSVNRSNVTGGKFKLAGPPRKRGLALRAANGRAGKENANAAPRPRWI